MVRKIFAAVIAVTLSVVSMSAQEPASDVVEMEGASVLMLPDSWMSRHHVSIGYGVLPIGDITGIISDLFPYVEGIQLAERWGTGSVNLGYAYRLNSSISVGGMFVYSGNMSDVVGEKGRYIYKNLYSILPQVQFRWYRSGIVTLYSRLALGVAIANIQNQSGTAIDNALTRAAFIFQVSPVGIEIGRSVAGYAEAGFGATGVLTVGLRKTF